MLPLCWGASISITPTPSTHMPILLSCSSRSFLNQEPLLRSGTLQRQTEYWTFQAKSEQTVQAAVRSSFERKIEEFAIFATCFIAPPFGLRWPTCWITSQIVAFTSYQQNWMFLFQICILSIFQSINAFQCCTRAWHEGKIAKGSELVI